MDIKNTENIESAIQHFIRGTANSDEQKLLLEWIKENPENSKLIFSEKDLWESSQLGSEVLDKIEPEQWLALQERISKQQAKNVRWKEIYRMAALVVVTLGIGWMSHFVYTRSVEARDVEIKTVESIRGQIKEIFLADGTHVWLNSDSKLSFPSKFVKNTREIELHGEAFFEVTSNEKNPFLVTTGNHTVKVTGTKFNICEYPGDKKIETTLVEGKVKIISGNFFKDLHPGEQATFYTETANVIIGKKDFDIYTAWREGRYEFKKESVSKIFQIMERWWDVEIDYPHEKLEHEYISGVLRKHKPIKQHLDVISELVPMEYRIDNDRITVKLKEK